MSVTQTSPRVAKAAISFDLHHEKTSEPFHISTEVSDLTLDGKNVICVSKAIGDAYLPLDNEKSAQVTQISLEADFASDDKNASSIHLAITEASLTVDNSSSVTVISSKILDIIFEYALNKFDDTRERHAAGAPKFLSIITGFVSAGKQL